MYSWVRAVFQLVTTSIYLQSIFINKLPCTTLCINNNLVENLTNTTFSIGLIILTKFNLCNVCCMD